MRTMYAVTHINKDGMRTLTHANQGRNHFDSEELAQTFLDAMRANNSPDTLNTITGGRADTLEVRAVECYDHGDAVRVYFDVPITRKDYMDGRVDHHTYYMTVADMIGRAELEQIVLAVASLPKLRSAYKEERNFNTIRLVKWDSMDAAVRTLVSHNAKRVMAVSWSGAPMTPHTYCWSLSETVCVLKAVAEEMVERAETEPTWVNQLDMARRQPDHELRRHALVSTRNQHRCENCYCCAALTVLEERHPGLTTRKLEAMDGN